MDTFPTINGQFHTFSFMQLSDYIQETA